MAAWIGGNMNANVEVVGTLNEIEGYRVQFKEVFAEAATLDCPCDLTEPELPGD